MKALIINFLLIILFAFGTLSPGQSMSIYKPPPVYVPINSLADSCLYYNISPHFKSDSFICEIEGQVLAFQWFKDSQPVVVPLDEKYEIRFSFGRLASYTQDSIYISASYAKKEKTANEFGRQKNIKLAIACKDLNGLSLLYYPIGRKIYQDHLIAGYTLIPRRKDERTNHAFELGWSRLESEFGPIFTKSYYFANEFVFNKDNFFIGPKLGGQFSFFLFGIGSDLVFYTDFHASSLQWVPFCYMGFGNYKLHIDARIPFYNKDFQQLNYFSFGVSMPIIPLSKKVPKL